MNDFIKWLGINEKIAKVVVWMLIIMVTLIIINAALKSLGFPHYQITYENIKDIDKNAVIDTISRIIVCLLNFYANMLLIFRVKKAKSIFKYAIIYVLLNTLIYFTFGYIATQIYIISFIIVFSYLYSGKAKKYILYGIGAIAFNIILEGLTYYFKARLIDLTEVTRFTRSLLSLDYFIIIGLIILVKEIYLKKRGEKNGKSIMVGTIQKRR